MKRTVSGGSMIKVGIVGCGTIGAELAQACQTRFRDEVQLTALADLDASRARRLQRRVRPRPDILEPDGLIKKCDLVIEAASAQAAYEIARKALSQGKDVMVMSVGGPLRRGKKEVRPPEKHPSFLF